NVNPDFLDVILTDNSATSDYHALQLKYQRRLSRGLQALASYSFAHSIYIASTDSTTGNVNTQATVAIAEIDRGNSHFDLWHSFTAGVVYEVPFPGTQAVAKAILSDWSVDTFVLARSAPPVNIVGAITFAGGILLSPRPDVNPGVPLELFGEQYP